MKRLSVAQQKRLTALEAERKPQVANAYMCVPEMPTSTDEWERIVVLEQMTLKLRSRNDGPELDDIAFPYPDEVVEYYKNRKWEYIA